MKEEESSYLQAELVVGSVSGGDSVVDLHDFVVCIIFHQSTLKTRSRFHLSASSRIKNSRLLKERWYLIIALKKCTTDHPHHVHPLVVATTI